MRYRLHLMQCHLFKSFVFQRNADRLRYVGAENASTELQSRAHLLVETIQLPKENLSTIDWNGIETSLRFEVHLHKLTPLIQLTTILASK